VSNKESKSMGPLDAAPTQAEGAETLKHVEPASAEPALVEGYRILQKLGEGGMGEVFLAEQLRPVRRRVALKLIKPGMDTRQVIARFESERQALALMNHQAVAKVLDAGSTRTGTPYFAMEYVPGVSITKYCDQHRLTIPQRLRLFMKVTEGIQHAHQKGILHRDIKPANVLVTAQENRAQPKVIDFGLAKAITHKLTDNSLFTHHGMLIGTPEYMSPEQAEMSALEVDTRTDIYSLGILLFELLTGKLPFLRGELREGGFLELQKRLRDSEPPRPSKGLSRDDSSIEEVAHKRQTDLRALRRILTEDLDWIVLKAMANDRTQRYQSASELNADITRYLEHQPILAGPPSTFYKAKKFVRRNRVAVGTAVVVFLALLVGAVGTSVGLLRARQAEQAAQKEAETARQVSGFLIGLFKGADPEVTLDHEITVREVVDNAVARVSSELADQPEVQATMMTTLGSVAEALGDSETSIELLEKALRISTAHLGENHLLVAESALQLASVLHQSGHPQRAEPLYRRALGIYQANEGKAPLALAHNLMMLAVLLHQRGEHEEGERLDRRSLELKRSVRGDKDLDVAGSLNNLGYWLQTSGDLAGAESLYRESLQIKRELLGDGHMRVAISHRNLSSLLAEQKGIW